MDTGKDIVLVLDYHSENIEYRQFNQATGQESTGRYPTSKDHLLRHLAQAAAALGDGGRIILIMESTTGWARVKELVENKATFILANVLQMPLPPKARRRKTDKIDTGRLLREYLHGVLPASFTPTRWWREVRRLVDYRQDLVERSTALKNQITSLLSHETWEPRKNLWSAAGRVHLAALMVAEFSASDQTLVELKLEQLDLLAKQIARVEDQIEQVYRQWPEAQWVDEIRGIGVVTAVSLLAHIGPIERFRTPEALIAYAGLAPSISQSDSTRRHGSIGGGGTDAHLRYLLMEASVWLRQVPRYRETYQRVAARRGSKIGRIVVARLALRSLYKMLTAKVKFDPGQEPGQGREAA